MLPQSLIEATHEADPTAAIRALIADLAEQNFCTVQDMEEFALTPTMQQAALRPRLRMEEEWEDVPRDCYVYASYARPVADYPELAARAEAVQPCAVDWPTCTPHAYVASRQPITLPQVELIRLPLEV